MKAEIQPLDGKYYGTEIDLQTPNGTNRIEVWVMGDYTPSEREKEKMIAYYKEEDPTYQFEEKDLNEWASDNHYESALGYRIAQGIVEMVKDW